MNKPQEWSKMEQEFTIKEWANLKSDWSGADMSRHFMILGETGSGKTKSAIIPLIKSILNYQTVRPSMLVIDPKNELYEHFETKQNIVRFNFEEHSIDFFEGVDLARATPDDLKSRIFSIFPDDFKGREPFWNNHADACIRAFFAIDLEIFKSQGAAGITEFWNSFTLFLGDKIAYYSNALKEPFLSKEEIQNNQNMLWHTKELYSFFNLGYDATNYFQKYSQLLNENIYLSMFLEFADKAFLFGGNEGISYLKSLVRISFDATFRGITATVQSILSTFTTNEFVASVKINPFTRSRSGCINVKEFMDSGLTLVFTPNPNSRISELIGRCVKAKFFELSFVREDMGRPFAYVCDEFQQFITADKSSGEQSFLDRCRAFKVICVLATQSISSLSYGLSTSSSASQNSAQDAINILLQNTGNKLFFRNTDAIITDKLLRLIPSPKNPVNPHVVCVQPTASLSVGECYYTFCNGNWGIAQIDLWKDHCKADQVCSA